MSTTCKSDSRVTGPRRVQTAAVLPNKPVVLESEWNPGQLKIKPEGVVLKIKGGCILYLDKGLGNMKVL